MKTMIIQLYNRRAIHPLSSLVSILIRRAFGIFVFAWAVIGAIPAGAQSADKPPIRILVGFTAGGTTDLAARLIAEQLETSLHRTVVVENRSGASGRVAAIALKQAPPDGNTLLLTPMVATMLAPLVWSKLDYDPDKDFAPVAQVSNYAVALAVGNEVPVHGVTELAAWAKESPTRANYGVSALGGIPHLFGVIVGREAGIPWVAVPYRGNAGLEADLLGGRIAAAMDLESNLIELHRAGRIHIIATSGKQRSPLLPEVPTFVEQGFNVTGTGWLGMYAPAGTPKQTIDELSAAIGEALRKPQVHAQMVKLGYEPTGTTPAELARISAEDAARWAPLIKETGFSAD